MGLSGQSSLTEVLLMNLESAVGKKKVILMCQMNGSTISSRVGFGRAQMNEWVKKK